MNKSKVLDLGVVIGLAFFLYGVLRPLYRPFFHAGAPEVFVISYLVMLSCFLILFSKNCHKISFPYFTALGMFLGQLSGVVAYFIFTISLVDGWARLTHSQKYFEWFFWAIPFIASGFMLCWLVGGLIFAVFWKRENQRNSLLKVN